MILERELREWDGYRRALRAEDRGRFDEMMRMARCHASAAMLVSRPFPAEPVILSILLEHHKELVRLRQAVARCGGCGEHEEKGGFPRASGEQEVPPRGGARVDDRETKGGSARGQEQEGVVEEDTTRGGAQADGREREEGTADGQERDGRRDGGGERGG